MEASRTGWFRPAWWMLSGLEEDSEWIVRWMVVTTKALENQKPWCYNLQVFSHLFHSIWWSHSSKTLLLKHYFWALWASLATALSGSSSPKVKGLFISTLDWKHPSSSVYSLQLKHLNLKIENAEGKAALVVELCNLVHSSTLIEVLQHNCA